MSQKRNPDDDYGENANKSDSEIAPDDKRRKSALSSFSSVVQEAMRLRAIQHVLEPMLRRVVKEEVESAIKKHVISFKRNCEEDLLPSESRYLQLKFLSALSPPVFTGAHIEGEDGSAIKVALIDSLTGEVVQHASESSARIEIAVLEGDFGNDEGENWTLEEFNSNIVREREGKKPLIAGDVYFYLKDGVGCVGNISLTDNSSWTRSRRFRLGARVAGNYGETRIKEARTESFIVRDHRGELYRKHHPPFLFDEVWRLEKIGKDGAFHKRLIHESVKTVKDFLILLNLDPVRLRNILGSGMSPKMWDVAIEHARTCVIDEKVYLYYNPSSQSSGVIFNAVGLIIGLHLESQYVPNDKLSETEKLDAQKSVIEAFQHWDTVFPFEDLNSLLGFTSHGGASSSTSGTPDGSKFLMSPKIMSNDYYSQPSVSSDNLSSLYSDDFSLQAVNTLDLGYVEPLNFPVQVTDSLLCGTGSMTPTLYDDDEHLRFFDMDYPISSTNSTDLIVSTCNSFFTPPHSPVKSIRIPNQRRWRILFSILRWLSILRLVSMRRTDQKERAIRSYKY